MWIEFVGLIMLSAVRSLHLGLIVRSLVSTNSWLRGIKTYRFPWYLTLVSANHASSNPGHYQFCHRITNDSICLTNDMPFIIKFGIKGLSIWMSSPISIDQHHHLLHHPLLPHY